jgi:type I restriction enzyme M protein
MRLLRRPGSNRGEAAAAVIVPDGTLFNVGVAARIKKELIEGFNLHTIVRMPFGVFEPYTPIRSTPIFRSHVSD